jgi:hypothetical protein
MIQNSSREEADAYMTSAVRRDSLGIGFGVYIARISVNRFNGRQICGACRANGSGNPRARRLRLRHGARRLR